MRIFFLLLSIGLFWNQQLTSTLSCYNFNLKQFYEKTFLIKLLKYNHVYTNQWYNVTHKRI